MENILAYKTQTMLAGWWKFHIYLLFLIRGIGASAGNYL